MSEAYVLDAWAVIAFLQKELPAAERVRQQLKGAEKGAARLFISIINLGEVYYRVGKRHGREAADEMLNALRALPLEILPANEDAVLGAARWKMKYPISYADAFAACTAEKHQALLLTGDPELAALAGEIRIEKLGGK